MIHRLLARLREFAAAEYWRTRCLKAEAQLEAERWRDVERSDTYLTALIMVRNGIFGMPPRKGPAQIPQQASPVTQGLRPMNPWDELGPVDKMEFETNWLPDAQAHNIPIDQAKQQFLVEIARRKPLNDDYQM